MTTKSKTATVTTAVANMPAPTQAIAIPNVPLNQTQLKNLQKLVDADFDDLRDQVLNELKQRFSRRTQEVQKQCQVYDDKASAIRTSVSAFLREEAEKLENKARALIGKSGAEVLGVSVLSHPCQINPHVEITIAGGQTVRAATDEVHEAYSRLRNQITVTIDRERRKVTRLVLLQGITATAATDLIASLPQPQNIYALVQAETAESHAEDIATLMGAKSSIIDLAAD